jgi:hypothetical protein
MAQENRGCSARGARRTAALLALLALPAAPSCVDLRAPDATSFRLPFDPRYGTQEGEVTVREGAEVTVSYKRPYLAPPRLAVVELTGSDFQGRPYGRNDFQFVKQEPASFTVRNNYTQAGGGSWATVKWRAEGPLAPAPAAPAPAPAGAVQTPALIQAGVKKLGGQATPDAQQPTGPVVTVDLHRTKAGDEDLRPLRGLPSLRTLNLFGTKVTDAGMEVVGELAGLQTLYLNDTAVTGAGLERLKGLKRLTELGLCRTGVTDDGLRALAGLPLHDLSLDGTHVTDAGLEQLRRLRTLRHLSVVHTQVTDAGVEAFRRARPDIQVYH